MINNVTLVGRLTKDPELRYTPSGLANTRFTLAINRPFNSQNGEKEADFVNCVAWRKQAENLANFMRKGSQIGVVGRIQTGSYEGQDGKRIFTTDVVAENIQFLEPRGSNEGGNAPAPNNGGYNQQQNAPQQQYQAPPQQQPQYNQSQQYGQQQQNYTRADEDPFANSKGPISVSEDDLPF